MKIHGNRILNSDIRFAFTVDGDEISTADLLNIRRLNEMVRATPNRNESSLSDVVQVLGNIAAGGEICISVEEISEDND